VGRRGRARKRAYKAADRLAKAEREERRLAMRAAERLRLLGALSIRQSFTESFDPDRIAKEFAADMRAIAEDLMDRS
jgi:hypothetical protein